MKTGKFLFGALLAGAVALAVLAGACTNLWPPESTPGPGGVTGKLTVNFGIEGELAAGAARTLTPVTGIGVFARYELSVTKTAAGADYDPVDIASGDAVELVPGTYTITVTAYTAGGEAAAGGTKAGVEISEEDTTPVSVTLGPRIGGANGTFSYDITLPAGLDSAELVVTTLEDEAVAGGTVDLLANPDPGTIDLAPGYYYVALRLQKGSQITGFRNEALHIYTGLESALPARTYGEEDFPGERTVTLLDLTGVCPAPVGWVSPVTVIDVPAGQYTGTIEWEEEDGSDLSGDFTAGTIYTAKVHLKAMSGYTFTGVEPDAFSHGGAGKVTNEADSGEVTIVFPAAGSGITLGQPVSADKLAAYLAAIPAEEGDTADNPHTVALDSSVDVNSATWGTTIKDALAGLKKYIVLDLSACAATGNTISGDQDPTGNHFNVINADYIAGLIFPDTLETIGTDVCNQWPSLMRVTIPDSVTSIGIFAFFGATALSDVTIPANVTSIQNGAFQGCSSITSITLPEGLTSVGNNAFYGCTSLAGITLPKGLTSVGKDTFRGCTSLVSVTLLRDTDVVSLPNANKDAFKDTHAELKIFVPESLVASYQKTSNWSQSSLKDRIKAIGSE
jgi:hypothetical protein